jgi:hypothetical protein
MEEMKSVSESFRNLKMWIDMTMCSFSLSVQRGRQIVLDDIGQRIHLQKAAVDLIASIQTVQFLVASIIKRLARPITASKGAVKAT